MVSSAPFYHTTLLILTSRLSKRPAPLQEMKFVLLEQKYLEHLEAGRALDALHVLRNELTPLGHDTARVHRLSALMMCAEPAELHSRAEWPGAGQSTAFNFHYTILMPGASGINVIDSTGNCLSNYKLSFNIGILLWNSRYIFLAFSPLVL